MADPLSLAASVAGLISLSGQIITVLSSFSSSALDARNSVTRVLSEIRSMTTIFGQIQDFMWGVIEEPLDNNKLSMISLDHLVATLTGCVLVYSELEKHISEMAGLTGLANVSGLVLVWERIKWAQKEPDIVVLMDDLQRHKSSLNLMLSIIQCQTASEARKSMRKLHSVMHEILQSNHQISNQLRFLMAREGAPDPNNPTTYSAEAASSMKSDIMSIMSTSTISTIRSFAFEAILRKSRPYKREALWDNPSMISFGAESVNICSWTLLSELSLGELSTSEISVFELPIYPTDLWNADHYKFSENPIDQTARDKSPERDIARTRLGPAERPRLRPLPHGQPLPFIRFSPNWRISDNLEPLIFPEKERIARYNGAVFRLGQIPPVSLKDPNARATDPFSSFVGFNFQRVSRKHCEVWYDTGHWYVKDVGSSNGTYLNGVRLSPPMVESAAYQLGDGDMLHLGDDRKFLWDLASRDAKLRRLYVRIGLSNTPSWVTDTAERDKGMENIPEENNQDLRAPLSMRAPFDSVSVKHEVLGTGDWGSFDDAATMGELENDNFMPYQTAKPTTQVFSTTSAHDVEVYPEQDFVLGLNLDAAERHSSGFRDAGIDKLEAGMKPMPEPMPDNLRTDAILPYNLTPDTSVLDHSREKPTTPDSHEGELSEKQPLSESPPMPFDGASIHRLQSLEDARHPGDQPSASPLTQSTNKGSAGSIDSASLLIGELKRLGLSDDQVPAETQNLLAGFVEYIQMQNGEKQRDEKPDVGR